jgi:CBS domain-containing protein
MVKIAENAPVYEAIKKMAANRIGALAVTSSGDTNTIIGMPFFDNRSFTLPAI